MAIPFSTVGDFARALQADRPSGALGGVIQSQQRNRLARSQNLANQRSAQMLAGMPAKQKAQALLNQLNQLKVQEQPQAFQSLIDLRAQQSALAKKRATEASSNWLKNPLAIAKVGQDLFKQNPNDSRIPILSGMLNNLVYGKKGISVTTTPKGGSSVQIGGRQQPGFYGETVVNPNMPGSRGGGGTFTDANSGQIYSAPTQATKGKLQQRIITDVQLKNNVDALGKWVKKSDYFNPASHVAAWSAPISKYIFPQSSQSLSNMQQISGQIMDTIDKVLQQSGLPRRMEIVNTLKPMLQPKIGENYNTWHARVMDQMKLFLKNQEENQKALKQGVKVGEQPFLRVRHAPTSFMDTVHPRYEYVHNPRYQSVSKPSISSSNIKYTKANLEYTAKKHNISVEELKKKLGIS